MILFKEKSKKKIFELSGILEWQQKYAKCPSKPEESQKNSIFNGKTIPYPGFKPRTSGLAVGSHNHCTIGSVIHKTSCM
jgi:hypothetical protein